MPVDKDKPRIYNESLANRARARATGADVHAVGELVSTYYFACLNSKHAPKRHAWNCDRIAEILSIYVDTKLSLKEAKAEQDYRVGIRNKDGLVRLARKYLKEGKPLRPEEFNTPGWKETWEEACRIATSE